MSYEGKMLEKLKMPVRKDVEEALLIALFRHNGVIKEFGSGEEIVNEIAEYFGLNEEQRRAYLETIYRKENRVKKSSLWHRLLFRVADSLAKDKLVSRPTQTLKITHKKEWMLKENGIDKALKLLNIPSTKKEFLLIKTFEVQKIVQRLNKIKRPNNYNPFGRNRKVSKITKEIALRKRGFRQAVIEAYNFKCAVCGIKIYSPDTLSWEVEAAHIVPRRVMGKDDLWNGMALCHLHHWAFDVGWFTLLDDYRVIVSTQYESLPKGFGQMGNYEFLKALSSKSSRILLPCRKEIYPHHNAIIWHRQNIFNQ